MKNVLNKIGMWIAGVIGVLAVGLLAFSSCGCQATKQQTTPVVWPPIADAPCATPAVTVPSK